MHLSNRIQIEVITHRFNADKECETEFFFSKSNKKLK